MFPILHLGITVHEPRNQPLNCRSAPLVKLRGRRCNRAKKPARGREGRTFSGDQNDTHSEPTADRLAKQHSVSAPTIKRDGKYAAEQPDVGPGASAAASSDGRGVEGKRQLACRVSDRSSSPRMEDFSRWYDHTCRAPVVECCGRSFPSPAVECSVSAGNTRRLREDVLQNLERLFDNRLLLCYNAFVRFPYRIPDIFGIVSPKPRWK